MLSKEDADRALSIAKGESGRVRDIVREVAALSSVPVAMILSENRTAQVVLARDLVCFVAHNRGHSDSAIGRAIGRDHTSVGTARRREEARRR